MIEEANFETFLYLSRKRYAIFVDDKKTLKNLLTKDVFITFENAIEREKNKPNYKLYSIVVDEVTDMSVIDSIINIT